MLAALMLLGCFGMASAQSDAEKALQQAKSKISSASSITASFSLNMGGGSVSGTLKAKKSKFSIVTSSYGTWYNGSDLYTYNAQNNETTVMKPTSSELAEANPLLYINNADDYKVTTTKASKSGVDTVVLIPKKSGSGIKSVTIELNKSTHLPKSIKITPTSGSAYQLTISSIKLNSSVADSSFDYPKSKYPGSKLIDLR